jgi:lipopolysaccharide/colanic/teichoic acid biosynthesis glycosyltransferase
MDKMIRRLNYDIVYMENMSLGLDLEILFHTIGVVLDGKGK